MDPEAARKADEKAAELKAVAAKKAAELQAATAEAIAAGVHPAAPLAAERPVSSGRGATQRKTTLPSSGGDAARADSDEPKVHGGGGAGSGGARRDFGSSARVLLPVAVVLLTLALRSTYPEEMDYVGFYMMLAIQGVLLVATLLLGDKDWADWAVLTGLGTLAALTRFWRIHDPQGIIFDEVRAIPPSPPLFSLAVAPHALTPSPPPPPPLPCPPLPPLHPLQAHFNKFSTWYVSRHYYVDIHPPLAKLAFALVLHVLGFEGAKEEKIEWWVEASRGGFIGTKDWLLLYEAEWGQMYVPLRRTSAFMGTLFVMAVFLTCRAVGMGRVAAAFGAWLAMAELVILVQSRAILCDIFLYFFNVSTIGASFAAMRPGLSERARLLWCTATGLLLGCAVSVKLTALGTLAVVGLHQTLHLALDPQLPLTPANAPVILRKGVPRALAILAPAAVVFFGLWEVHLRILRFSGQGDNFMNDVFKGTLETKPPAHPKPHLMKPEACPNIINTWSDCGYAGISEQQCLDKGCCWDPTSPRAWCYHLGPLTRPKMAWWPKIKEVLRATWANNNVRGGGLRRLAQPALPNQPPPPPSPSRRAAP